jgi:hypothetical protein
MPASRSSVSSARPTSSASIVAPAARPAASSDPHGPTHVSLTFVGTLSCPVHLRPPLPHVRVERLLLKLSVELRIQQHPLAPLPLLRRWQPVFPRCSRRDPRSPSCTSYGRSCASAQFNPCVWQLSTSSSKCSCFCVIDTHISNPSTQRPRLGVDCRTHGLKGATICQITGSWALLGCR